MAIDAEDEDHDIVEEEDQSTIHQVLIDPSPPPVAGFTLQVVEGPDTGRVFTLDPSAPAPLALGSGSTSDLRVGDRSVSRRHATLEVSGSRIRVVDAGSRNGTFVDGIAVTDAYLRGGETLRVGQTALRVAHTPGAKNEPLPPATRFGTLIGASTEMRRLYPTLERIAQSSVPVVIEGETGTGKEVLAESLHAAGPRRAGPFIVFDCTAVPANLMESELFGHERGAFTGAVTTRKGVFEQANGGTLLIDEIGDLDLSLQPKLLRAIERSQVRRVGGNQWLQVDVRILAATRRSLPEEVEAGRFRDDLFHRLAVARVELPPLRRRAGDVVVLARHFAAELGPTEDSIPPDLLWRWQRHAWPGNVRELRNAVARFIALGELATASGADVAATDPGTVVESILAMDLPLPEARNLLLAEFELLYLQRALDRHGGNVTHAAAASGLARRYFQLLRAKRRRDQP